MRVVMHKKTKRSQPLCENRVQLPKDFSFNWYEALLIIVLALFYLADILTDCNVAYTHYKIMIEASLRSTNSSSQLSYYDNNTDYVELMNGTSTDEHDDDYDAYHQWSVIVQLCFSFIIIPSLVAFLVSAPVSTTKKWNVRQTAAILDHLKHSGLQGSSAYSSLSAQSKG